jgi:hypothetical protein
MTVTSQNLIQEEIKRRPNSNTARRHSDQSFLSFLLLSTNKNQNMQVHNFSIGSVWVQKLVSEIKGGNENMMLM